MDFIYHLFNEKKEKVFNLQNCPIILSIMSIRFFYPESKIYVFDYTPHNHDWEMYEKKLGVIILKTKNKYENIPKIYQKILHIYDFMEIFKGPICGIDSDIIIKKNYNFVDDNLFHVYFHRNKTNCGLYYFKNQIVCRLWVECIINCFNKSFNIDCFLKQNNYYKLSDESILSFLLSENKDLFSSIDELALIGEKYKYSDKNWYHFLTVGSKNKKDLILKFEDFYDIFLSISKNKNIDIILPNPSTSLKKYYKKI